MVNLLVPGKEVVPSLEHMGVQVVKVPPIGILDSETLDPGDETLVSEMVSAECPESEASN